MKQPFVVAIGFSAGGLAPLKAFFDHTPLDDTAYIVISHLLPGYKSEIKTILQRHSALQIVEATDGLPIIANNVYVLSEPARMTIAQAVLDIQPLKKQHAAEVIDVFFQSLAVSGMRHIAAVLLSGAGSDGTKGIAAIKAAGGMAMVQSPHTCEFENMPRHAIESGLADFILSPDQMPAYLETWEKESGGAEPIDIGALNFMLRLGKTIRRIRQDRNMAQQTLAGICGMQKSSISKIESGKKNATMDSLGRIASALGVEIKDFF